MRILMSELSSNCLVHPTTYFWQIWTAIWYTTAHEIPCCLFVSSFISWSFTNL